ncbi:oligosaccharide repeat unit polymerase [Chryseobacterium koreense]|uniref:oligosaccharide repeat unit polymerase n=1 Tax=Chryseobacterium koreense TaxID=232216 RepID=UPI0026F0180B|nr:oligosaccharide repeat unit polymerase [Chryseobacterium koreense]
MAEVIINFLLYLFALFFHWKKFKVIDNGFILLATYCLVALACVSQYMSAPLDWQGISLIPLLFLFGVNLLFFRPYLVNNNLITDKIQIKMSPVYFIFIYIYIILGGVVVFYGYDKMAETILRNDWNAVRQDVYSGDNVIYENQLERFAKIFTGFLQPMAILFFFYLLSEAFVKKHILTIVSLMLAVLIPSFLTIVSVASRGMIVLLIVQFLVSYFVFKKNISKKTNRIIKFGSLFFLAIFVIYSMSVTQSRFGESEGGGISGDAEDSLLFYFGHSMLTFADGIADSIKSFLWGDYLFGKEEILKVGIDNLVGTHFDTKFFTYVGALYLDFGPFFTFIIAIIFPFLMALIFRYKKKLDMADLMIYVYYLTFLINGVFVVGIGYYVGWMMIFSIYIIFKIVKLIA